MKRLSRVLIVLLLSIPVFTQETPPHFKNCAIVDHLPVAPPESEARKRANSRYDNEGWVGAPPREQYGGVGRIDEVAPPVPYPVFESTLVAIGRIAGSEAFLSNDKHGVYTEFAFQINEIIKNESSKQLSLGDKVLTDRAGGCVRYAGGKIMHYGMSDHGLPFVGKTYLLFLKREGPSPNYKILNGYEIDGEKPGHRLEYYNEPENYQAMTTSSLIEAVRTEMVNPVYRLLEINTRPEDPVRIRSVKTDFGDIVSGEGFAAESNWLRQLRVEIENVSNRRIGYLAVCLCFPSSEGQAGKSDYGYILDRGIDPSRAASYVGYEPPLLRPGEKAVLSLDEFDYRDVEYQLQSKGYEPGFSRVRLCVKEVVFAEQGK